MSDLFDTSAFARELMQTSDDIKREVGALIAPAAAQMASILRGRYPTGRKNHPGVKHMDDDIRITARPGSSDVLPSSRVIGPRLASIWQDGTVDRFDNTRRNARRGKMPAAAPRFFQHTAVAVRTAMLQKAQAIVDRPRDIGSGISGGPSGSLL